MHSSSLFNTHFHAPYVVLLGLSLLGFFLLGGTLSFAEDSRPKDKSKSISGVEQQITRAMQFWKDNDLEKAEKTLEVAEAALTHTPNTRLQVYLLTVRCQIFFAKGDYAEATTNNDHAFSLLGIDEYPKEKANLMLCHAQILERLGDSGAATKLLDEVYLLASKNNLLEEKGVALYIKGQFLGDLGNSSEALIILDEANTIFRSLNDANNISNVLNAMANILYYENNHKKAIEYYLEVDELIGDDAFQQSTMFYNLGNCYLALDNLKKAETYFLRSGEKSQQIDDVPGIAYTKFGLAKVSLSKQDYDRSLGYLEQAKSIFASLVAASKQENE